MTIFVFCVNLCIAAFIVAVAVEISALLIGSFVFVKQYWERKRFYGT